MLLIGLSWRLQTVVNNQYTELRTNIPLITALWNDNAEQIKTLTASASFNYQRLENGVVTATSAEGLPTFKVLVVTTPKSSNVIDVPVQAGLADVLPYLGRQGKNFYTMAPVPTLHTGVSYVLFKKI
jgi:hypothetical protein